MRPVLKMISLGAQGKSSDSHIFYQPNHKSFVPMAEFPRGYLDFRVVDLHGNRVGGANYSRDVMHQMKYELDHGIIPITAIEFTVLSRM